MSVYLGNVQPHVWNTLTQGADRYHKTVVNYIEDADDPVDSDGMFVSRANDLFLFQIQLKYLCAILLARQPRLAELCLAHDIVMVTKI